MSSFHRAAQKVRPLWIEDMATFHHGRIARQFVLHFNITDYIIDLSERRDAEGGYTRHGYVVTDSDTPQMLRQYLDQFLFETLACQSIYTYSLANGLSAEDAPVSSVQSSSSKQEHGTGMQLLYDLYHQIKASNSQRAQKSANTGKQDGEFPTEIPDIFRLLSNVLRQQDTPIAVVLDYAEKLIPYHLGEGQGDREQLQVLEMVQRWALDPQIRQTNNIIILLTTNIGSIPTSVYAEGSGCRAIRISLPDEYEREAFIRFKMAQTRARLVPLHKADFGLLEAEQAHRLARATQGMRLTDIDNMSRRVAAEFEKQRNQRTPEQTMPLLKSEHVQKIKAEVIQAQSADLLEIVPPMRGFTEIGGLDNFQ